MISEIAEYPPLAFDLPNRSTRRAALGGRASRASYLIDRHDERSIRRLLPEMSEDDVRESLAGYGFDYDEVADEGLEFIASLSGGES